MKHSLNTMAFVTSIVEQESLSEREKRTFRGPLAWSASEMSGYVATLENGKYAALAPSFTLSGKLFSVEWIGHVQRRAVAAGGTEGDGTFIYDSFHDLLAKHKKAAAKKKTVGGGGGGGGGDIPRGGSNVNPGSGGAGGRTTRDMMKAKFAAKFSSDDVVVAVAPGRRRREQNECSEKEEYLL
jgi:hypothetical protein